MDILGFEVPLWLMLLAIILVIVYRDWRKQTRLMAAFDEQGIPRARSLPFLGSLIALFSDVNGFDTKFYYKHGRPPVFSMFMPRKPTIVVFNKDLVKQILVKDFNYFVNRQPQTNLFQKPMDKMISVICDDEWRNVRAHMSPTFSGSKMRKMISHINDCGRNVVASVETAVKAGDNIELCELSQRYALDVISKAAFGLDFNCHDKNNIFTKMVNDLSAVNLKNPLFWLVVFVPKSAGILRKMGYSPFKQKPMRFFVDIVDKAIQNRKDNDSSACDFLQLMIDSNEEFEQQTSDESSPHRGLTKDEILAQCLIFFSAGNSTIANVLYTTLYNLARNPEEQEKAHIEVEQLMDEDGFTYENQKKLQYVDMCIEETMRLFTPAPRTDRQCSEDVTICGVRIPKGTIVQIPIATFHTDPEVWDDPEKFNPERFSPEAKQSFEPYQYMPFGGGPRMCIAQRLAMMEVKIGLAFILHKYRVVATEKTPVPLERTILQTPKKGAWVKFELRD